MKTIYRLGVMMFAVVALLMLSMPVQASKMDNNIESSAKKSYVFQTYLKADDIKVKSEDGVVSLTGTVSEESHKSLAQETVADLPGVKSVDNMLEVKGTPPAKMSDAWITAKVKTIFLFHRNVSAMTEVDTKAGIVTLQGKAANEAQKALNTSVKTKRGIVTLSGKAKSGAEMDLATKFANDVNGVKSVNNQMTIE